MSLYTEYFWWSEVLGTKESYSRFLYSGLGLFRCLRLAKRQSCSGNLFRVTN